MIDRVVNRVEMALNEIFYMLYIVDILIYPVIGDSCGIGKVV